MYQCQRENINCKSVALQEHNVLSCFLSCTPYRRSMYAHSRGGARACMSCYGTYSQTTFCTLLHETLHEYSSLSSINLNPLLSSTLPTAGHPQSDYHQHLRLRPAHGSGPNNCVCRHGKYCHNVKIIFLLKSQNSARFEKESKKGRA